MFTTLCFEIKMKCRNVTVCLRCSVDAEWSAYHSITSGYLFGSVRKGKIENGKHETKPQSTERQINWKLKEENNNKYNTHTHTKFGKTLERENK